MKLVLDLPSDWQVENLADGAYDVRIPHPGDPGDLTMHVSPLAVRDDNLIRWTERILAAELGNEIELVGVDDSTTDLGWPVRKLLVQQAGSRYLYAFYHFYDHIGQVTVSAAKPELLELHLKRLDTMLSRARPDFSTDEVAALAQLWT